MAAAAPRNSDADEPLLVQGDCEVYLRDAVLVTDAHWWNDHLLYFALRCARGEHPQVEDVCVASPQAAFVLLHEEDPEDFADTLDGLLARHWRATHPEAASDVGVANAEAGADAYPGTAAMLERTTLLLPLNDDRGASQRGGQHWTLLAWLGVERQFLLCDSAPAASPDGGQRALRLATKIARAAGAAGSVAREQGEKHRGAVAGRLLPMFAVRTPLQPNSYDCGPYVLHCARQLLHFLDRARAHSSGDAALLDLGEPADRRRLETLLATAASADPAAYPSPDATERVERGVSIGAATRQWVWDAMAAALQSPTRRERFCRRVARPS